MLDTNDMELLGDYARNGSETAFAELVQRHIALVYSAALRHAGIAAQAEEITQAVFIILARKAGGLRPGTVLEGWLYETTRLTALSFLRGDRRRQFREQEAYMQSTLQETPENSAWEELSPLLDEAMARLGKKDRDAVVLRFFKEKSVRDVAATMQMNEVAVQRRILRALEKLRKYFSRRGVVSTTAIIAGVISANSVHAAPTGLAKAVSTMAAAKGAAASASTATLIKGALKLMAWTKTQTAIVAGAVVLLAAGTTTITVEKIREHLNDEWQLGNISSDFLYKPPYRTVILPTKSAERSPQNGTGGNSETADGRGYGINESIEDIARFAYYQADGKGRDEFSPARTILDGELPTNQYDYFSNLPRSARDTMQNEIRKKFGLTGEVRTIETNVLVLEVAYSSSTGLKPSRAGLGNGSAGNGKLSMKHETMDELAMMLETILKIPVINQTKLNGDFDFQIQWNEDGPDYPDPEGLKRALNRQLGLVLVPTNMPIEMLVVDRSK
jgi:RNA polymerase sigma factor (sigma-70 family)